MTQYHLGYCLIPSRQCQNLRASIALEDFLKCPLQISCSHAIVNKCSTSVIIELLYSVPHPNFLLASSVTHLLMYN